MAEHHRQGRVRVYTLGRFLLQVDDVQLRFGRKTQKRPLQLLKALIALGGEAISVERLCESLWPDADGDHAYDSFRSALSRLRKLIGLEAVRLHDGRLSLDPATCWVDVNVFEHSLDRARQFAESADDASTSLQLEEALGTYQGPFLDGEFDPPEILSARERLHSRFLRHLSELGAIYRRHGQHGQAIEVYRKGLEIDDLAEEVYQQLMRCYLEAGRIAEGMAIYQRCRDTLQAQLGIEPSEETLALHQALSGGEGRRRGQPPEPPDRDASDAVESPVVALPVERRLVTVMAFALEGYWALCERLDVDALQVFMTRFREELERIVSSHGGLVNQLQRNEATAVFGLPTAHEDDAARAVRTALQAHGELSALMAGLVSGRRVAVGLKAGVATGTLVAQDEPARGGRYALIGDASRVADRLLVEADRGETLLDERTWRRCRYLFQAEPKAGPQRRGRRQPGPVAYRVTGATDLRTPFQVAARRGFTPFTGREVELSTLHDCLQRTLQGEGQLVTVSGEAGVGKSRLVHEFGRSVDRGQFTIVEGNCQAHGSDTPYLPFLDALRRGMGLESERTVAAARERVVAEATAIDPTLERYLSHYLHLLSIPSAEHPLPDGLQDLELAAALREALCAIFTASARKAPLLVLLEDWHWADEASEAVLRDLAGLVGACRLMLVVTFRPEDVSGWIPLRHHTPLQLKPLDPAGTESIVRAVWNVATLPVGAAAAIHGRTGGNPYFTEETCRTLLEEGIVSVKGRWAAWARESAELLLPDSVQAVIRTRMDRLVSGHREVLQVASVIGREFPLSLLREVVPVPDKLGPALERCRELQLVAQSQVVPEPAYRFVHVLTQVVALDSLPPDERRALHGRVGRAIEKAGADRIEAHYEALAHHYGNSGDTAKAIEYLERAGDKAARTYSVAEAAAHYQACLQRMEALPASASALARRLEVIEKAAPLAFFRGGRAMVPLLETAHGLADAQGHGEGKSMLAGWLGHYYYRQGEFEQAERQVDALLGQPATAAQSAVRTRLVVLKARIHMHMAEFDAALACFPEPSVLESGGLSPGEKHHALGILAVIQGAVGDFEAAAVQVRRLGEDAEHLPRDGLSTMYRAMAHGYAGSVHYWKGDWPAATQENANCRELSERAGIRLPLAWGQFFGGASEYFGGRRQEALRLLRDALALMDELRIGVGMSHAVALPAEVFALAGLLDEAQPLAENALDLAGKANRFGEINARRALALMAAQQPSADPDEVRARFADCLALAQARRIRPDLGVTHFRFAEALHRLGDIPAAREQLTAAREVFRDLDMAWWEAEAQALGGRLAVGSFQGFAPLAS